VNASSIKHGQETLCAEIFVFRQRFDIGHETDCICGNGMSVTNPLAAITPLFLDHLSGIGHGVVERFVGEEFRHK
jgi:hypothetical protein